MFSHITIKGNRLIKEYVEHRGETDSPYLNIIGLNAYVFNWLCENDIHKRLLTKLPGMFPKIYNYSEIKYLDVDEQKRPPIPKPLAHRKPESLMICKVEMDYLPYTCLYDIIDKVITDEKLLTNILTQWFELQLTIIKEAHILPFDIHIKNMLYDETKHKIHLIDYGFYEFFNLVDRLNESDDLNKDTIYWFNPTSNETKHKIYKDYNKKAIKLNDSFELTDDEVKDLFMFRLMWFSNRLNENKLHYNISSKLGIQKCIELHQQVMNNLKFKPEHIQLITEAIQAPDELFKIGQSIRNWLGGPYGKVCSSHKLLTYLKIFPEQFNKCYEELKDQVIEYQKLNRDEFWKLYIEQLRQTKSALYCQMAYTMYLKYNPFDELNQLLKFIDKNIIQLNHPLYRCETTDRFNDSNNQLTVGKTIKWENLIPGTENRQYALTYLSNGRGTSVVSQNKPQHYLFVFNNIKAVHLHDYYTKFTTYTRRYNASDVNDNNRLNCFFPCCVVVSNEWIIDPFKEFKVVKTYMIKSKEIKPPNIISNNPIKEEYTGNILDVNVVELAYNN